MDSRNKVTLVLAAAIAVGGCTIVRYERDGETFSKYTLGTHRAFEDLEVTVGEGASRRQVILRGYESDGSQALEAVARGASEGVMKGMVPVP